MSDDIWRRRDDTTGGAKTPDYGTDYGSDFGTIQFADDPTSEPAITFADTDSTGLPHWTEPPSRENPRVGSGSPRGNDPWSAYSDDEDDPFLGEEFPPARSNRNCAHHARSPACHAIPPSSTAPCGHGETHRWFLARGPDAGRCATRTDPSRQSPPGPATPRRDPIRRKSHPCHSTRPMPRIRRDPRFAHRASPATRPSARWRNSPRTPPAEPAAAHGKVLHQPIDFKQRRRS